MTELNQAVINVIEEFFRLQGEFDGDGILNLWHTEGMVYMVGNNNQFRINSIKEQCAHINEVKKKVPDIRVDFLIDSVEEVSIQDDLIATARVQWRMMMLDSYGKHRSFYNLVKIGGRWVIVNVVDRGLEIKGDGHNA